MDAQPHKRPRETVEKDGQRKVVYVRRDQLHVMLRNKALGTVEYAAGRRLQDLREKASIGPVRAVTMERIFQDPDVRRARQDAAGDALRHFQRVRKVKDRMSPQAWAIVSMVCFSEASYPDIARALGRGSARRIGRDVRTAFEELANTIDRI